ESVGRDARVCCRSAGDLPLILCEPCAIHFISKRVCSTVILWTLDSSVCLWDNTATHNSRWAPMGHRSVHHIPHSCCQARLGKRSCPSYWSNTLVLAAEEEAARGGEGDPDRVGSSVEGMRMRRDTAQV